MKSTDEKKLKKSLDSENFELKMMLSLAGPLITYLLHGYVIGDNFQKIFKPPSIRSCLIYLKDCERVIDFFDISNYKIAKILYFKILTHTFLNLFNMNEENIIIFRENKRIEIDVEIFIGLFWSLVQNESQYNFEILSNYLKNTIKKYSKENEIPNELFSDAEFLNGIFKCMKNKFKAHEENIISICI